MASKIKSCLPLSLAPRVESATRKPVDPDLLAVVRALARRAARLHHVSEHRLDPNSLFSPDLNHASGHLRPVFNGPAKRPILR